MGYKVKWVEENLGISRKSLRVFERVGLMPKNEEGKYRDYSDGDVERIWTIRQFQGLGYSLKEIVDLFDGKTMIEASLEEKVSELIEKKKEIERLLGYAEYVKLTGRILRPTEIGSETFEEFHKKSLKEWSVDSDPISKRIKETIDILFNTPEDELQYTDIGKFMVFLQDLQDQISQSDSFMMEKVIPVEILKRKQYGATDSEVQLLVKMLYEKRMKSIPEQANMTKSQFVENESSKYLYGDIARIYEHEYGKEGCLFIADAIAVFGGYNSYNEIDE